ANVGQTVRLNATVSPVAPATGAPTGTVTFRDGATTLATVTLVNGSASFSISTLAPGSHALTAVYSGSATFAASTSAVLTQVVNARNAATSLTSTPTPPNTSTAGTAAAPSTAVASAAAVPKSTVAGRRG